MPLRQHPLSLRLRLFAAFARVDWMMLFPVAVAIAWSYGQDAIALVLVVVLPLCLALDLRSGRRRRRDLSFMEIAADQPVARPMLTRIVDDVLADCTLRDRTTAVLRLQVEDLQILAGGWQGETGNCVMDRVVQRVSTSMRGQDAVLRCGDDGVFAILAPTLTADLDAIMTIVDRIQAAVTEPISVEGRAVRVHCSIGICSERMAPERTGAAMLAAAECALQIARRQGPDAVRTFNTDIRNQVEIDRRLSTQVEDALDAGQIQPWFQPQVDTRSGRLAGFEALARWTHPDLGVLSPGQFLETIASAGRSGDLGELILRAALDALVEWDNAGLDVPCVGINVSLEELADPRMAERIIWQVDGYDLSPDRIAIEILETVTLRDSDEVVTRNIKALRDAGFRLDLDDFGTGAASIAHIARFGVHRIKIDRSFVHGIDRDSTQADIVSAILSLAERLKIDTLAEGVETPEERETLAKMGCPHIQGFGIARPMPFLETVPWALSLRTKTGETLQSMQPRGTA